MFCPNCGTDNAKGQKFCTRCGTNLLAIERAREIVSEMTSSAPVPQVSPNLVFIITALISVVGFIAITAGMVTLAEIPGKGPETGFLCLSGFTSLVLICRYLLTLIRPAGKPEKRQVIPPAPPQFPAAGTTNRSLGEAPASYQSVIEDPTRQFEHERRSNS
jgi:hypothetical protein